MLSFFGSLALIVIVFSAFSFASEKSGDVAATRTTCTFAESTTVKIDSPFASFCCTSDVTVSSRPSVSEKESIQTATFSVAAPSENRSMPAATMPGSPERIVFISVIGA